MKRVISFLISLFLLTACVPVPTSMPTATTTAALTETLPPLSASNPPASSQVPATSTPVPCDPFTVDFCIVDGHFVFQRPIHTPANDSVERTYPFASTDEGRREPHHGVEFINGTGTPVFAAADGTILFAGPDKEAIHSPWKNFYGNVIVIHHADDLFTLYAHLSIIDVLVGRQVKAGDKIGEVGKTGGAIGSHLHFEVRRREVEDYFSALNPELWLIPRMGEGVLAISVVNALSKFRHTDLTIQTNDKSYFIKTYEEEFTSVEENAALGDLTPGRYRITFYSGGHFFERWVEVQSAKLTQVVFVVE